MECKVNPQMLFLEDFCNPEVTTSTTTVVSGEDLFVDQLLNLNNDDDENDSVEQLPNFVVKEEQHQFPKEEDNSCKFSHFLSPTFDAVLSVPAEEADLEWLSHFVEESFSQFSTPYPPGFLKPKPGTELTLPNLSKSRRSKRARTGGRVWSAAGSDTSSPFSTPPCSPLSPGIGPPKKQQKKESGPGPSGGGGGLPRRCSHCGVQKTPQWRAGPEGSKTLCNACGVRFKSGRLLPEYRPACSPTFSSELHSNSHRKVLEMRKKKETGQPDSDGGFHHPVSSFG